MVEIVGLVMAAVTTVGLAWVAAWQQRASHEVRKLNGTVASAVQEVAAEVTALHPKLDEVTALAGRKPDARRA